MYLSTLQDAPEANRHGIALLNQWSHYNKFDPISNAELHSHSSDPDKSLQWLRHSMPSKGRCLGPCSDAKVLQLRSALVQSPVLLNTGGCTMLRTQMVDSSRAGKHVPARTWPALHT